MHDIYYASNIFPWAGFDEAWTTQGAISRQDALKLEWLRVFGGSSKQLISAIEKLNPIRQLDDDVVNYQNKGTTDLFHKLITCAVIAKRRGL